MDRFPENKEEKVVISLDHASLTATTTLKMWKVPTGKSFVLDRASYINPTGLAEDTTNVFAGEVTSSITPPTFTGEADDDTLTATAHGLRTGDGPYQVSNSGGALPGGLSALTNYWVIRTGVNTFKLATSYANALAETAVALSTDGTGTHTLQTNVMSRLFNTDSDLTPDVGASLAADTFVEGTVTGTKWLAEGAIISFVATEGGIATLPAGRLVLEGRLI